MIKTNGKLHRIEGPAFCFLASVIVAFAAMKTGLLTEPGKIIPEEISMRSGEMNGNILRGIDLAMDDIALIKDGIGGTSLWRMLTFVHADLFFYLALLLPAEASKTILLAGYYLRFGLCCSAMYYFLAEHIKINRLPSALLGAMYAFSSQIIFTAQFASVMNMAVMIPVLMSAFDSYLQKRNWKAYLVMCISSFGLCFSGGFGVMTGVPVMILLGLLMCISLYKTFSMAFTSWLKLISGLAAGLLMDAAFVIPGFSSMNISVNITESFSNAKVSYTVFDTIRGMFLLRSGNISVVGVPVFYIGTLTAAAVIVFAVNQQIPVRLKVAAGFTVAFIHITCCSTFVNEIVSVFGTAPLLNSSKLIGLEAVLFLIAGIGLKNAKSLDRGGIAAAALIPLFFLIVSNVDSAGTTLSSTILIATFAGSIGAAVLVYSFANDRILSKAKYAVLSAVYILVGFNAMFIMFNNSLSGMALNEYFKGNADAAASRVLISDNTFDIPGLSENDMYMLLPGDFSSYKPSRSVIDDENHLAESFTGNVLFDEVDVETNEIKGFKYKGSGLYGIEPGRNVLVLSPRNVPSGERIFVYCSAEHGASLKIERDVGGAEKSFTGPFITEVEDPSGQFSLRLSMREEKEGSCFILVYSLNEQVFNELTDVSGEANPSSFMIDIKEPGRTNTLILPYAFREMTVNINGKEYDTFECLGMSAVAFDPENSDKADVVLGGREISTVPGILISILAVMCLIAIPIIQRYNVKKKESGEGNNTDA